MTRALELARSGVGWCSPNPAVGAVLVRDGTIIGEGFHSKAGAAHAEVEAIRSASHDCRGAQLYVTLEPCNHTGRTPPCTQAIIDAGIADVIISVSDPNPHVAGGGIQLLRQRGITVETGVLQAEGNELIRSFAFYAKHQRPYVIAKFAASLDGRIATRTGISKWISGEASRSRVHQLRHEVDSILVGVNTIISDDPRLDARRGGPSNDPRPIVLDSAGRTPLDANVIRTARVRNTIIATTEAMPASIQHTLESAGCSVWRLPANGSAVDIQSLLDRLGREGVQSMLVEGGPTVLGSFFDEARVNEVWAFIAPVIIGGTNAPGAIGGIGVAELSSARNYQRYSTEQLDDDILIRLKACSQE